MLYRKYNVTRDDDAPPSRAEVEPAYFVLDIANDEYARFALAAYARALGSTDEETAQEIREVLNGERPLDVLRQTLTERFGATPAEGVRRQEPPSGRASGGRSWPFGFGGH